MFWMLFSFFWVISRLMNVIYRRFGTLCSIFIVRVRRKKAYTKEDVPEWSETSADTIQTPEHHLQERIQHKIVFNGMWNRIVWLSTSVLEGLVYASSWYTFPLPGKWRKQTVGTYISNHASLKSHFVTGLLDRSEWKHTRCMCFRITAMSFTLAPSRLRVIVCTAGFPNRSLPFRHTALVCPIILYK